MAGGGRGARGVTEGRKEGRCLDAERGRVGRRAGFARDEFH